MNPDLGEVWESEAAVARVRLANNTDELLRLSQIRGNCGCTRVEPEAAWLQARGELELRLVIDLTDRKAMDVGKLSRPFDVGLTIEVAGKPTKSFALAGTCRSHIATNATVLHFGESNVRGSPPVPRWLTVTADEDTSDIRVIPNDAVLRVGTFERHGNVWRVPITPDHAHIRERFDTALRVDALDRAGKVIGVSRVAVDGVVRDPEELLWEGAHAP